MAKQKMDFSEMDLGLDEAVINNERVFKRVNIKQLDENPENDNIYEYDREADDFLKEDIKINGILNPIIIIKSDTHAGRYTIVSGHRRTRIAKELSITELEAREIIARTPQEKAFAKIMLITANSTQRDRKPSEKAKEVLYLKSVTQGSGIENLAMWISKATKMSERNVYRYEKLANQPVEVQEAVDKGEMSVKQAIGEMNYKKGNKLSQDTMQDAIIKQACKAAGILSKLVIIKNSNGSGTIDEEVKKYLEKSVESLKELLKEF